MKRILCSLLVALTILTFASTIFATGSPLDKDETSLWDYMFIGGLMGAVMIIDSPWDFTTWEPKDQKLELTWQALNVADFVSTHQALKRPDVYEANPIIRATSGDRPTDGQLVGWAIGFAALHYIVTPLMPNDVWWGRPLWHWVGIGSKVLVTGNNIIIAEW